MNGFNEFLTWEKASRNKIRLHKFYVDMAGDIVAGLVLSEIVYWHLPDKDGNSRMTVERDGYPWIACPRANWWERSRLTPKQFDRAAKILIGLGLITKKLYRFKGAPTVHVRINTPVFMQHLNAIIEHPLVNPYLSDLPQKSKSKLKPDFPQTVKSNFPKGENPISPKGKNKNAPLTAPLTSTKEQEQEIAPNGASPQSDLGATQEYGIPDSHLHDLSGYVPPAPANGNGAVVLGEKAEAPAPAVTVTRYGKVVPIGAAGSDAFAGQRPTPRHLDTSTPNEPPPLPPAKSKHPRSPAQQAQDAMGDAIMAAFGWTWKTATKAEQGVVHTTAKQLIEVEWKTEAVGVLYDECVKRDWKNFSPAALLKVVSDVRKTYRSAEEKAAQRAREEAEYTARQARYAEELRGNTQ